MGARETDRPTDRRTDDRPTVTMADQPTVKHTSELHRDPHVRCTDVLCMMYLHFTPLVDRFIPVRTRLQDLTRFNKICHPSQRPRWQVDKEAIGLSRVQQCSLLITRPPDICVNLVFKHIHAASSYTICRQFVPFIYCPL